MKKALAAVLLLASLNAFAATTKAAATLNASCAWTITDASVSADGSVVQVALEIRDLPADVLPYATPTVTFLASTGVVGLAAAIHDACSLAFSARATKQARSTAVSGLVGRTGTASF